MLVIVVWIVNKVVDSQQGSRCELVQYSRV